MKHLKTFLMSGALLIISLSQGAHSVVFGLKGTYNTIPEELKPYSPLHGVILFETGELKKIYHDPTDPFHKLVRSMFRKVDEKILCIKAPSSPVSVLTPSFIKKIIDYGMQNDYTNLKLEFPLQNELAKDWWNTYDNWPNRSDNPQKRFKRFGHEFFRFLQQAKELDPSKMNSILSAFVYLSCDNPEDLQNYFKLFFEEYGIFPEFTPFTTNDLITIGLKCNSQQLPEPATYVEEIVFYLTEMQRENYSFLEVSTLRNFQFSKKIISTCVEDTLQTIINCMLYDPKEKILSFSTITPKANPPDAFKNFIEKYKNPNIKGYYSITLEDWIKMLATIPGIEKDTDIKWSKNLLVKILSHLFGIPLAKESDITLLSSDKRKFSYNTDNTTLTINADSFNITVKIDVASTHASAHIVNDALPKITPIFLENIFRVGQTIPADLLKFDINWYILLKYFSDKGVESFIAFCKKYNLTPSQINAPSHPTERHFLIDDFIKHKNVNLIKALIELGVDINHYPDPDLKTKTLLGTALISPHINADVLDVLIKNGATLTEDELYKKASGETKTLIEKISGFESPNFLALNFFFNLHNLDYNRPFNEYNHTILSYFTAKACHYYLSQNTFYYSFYKDFIEKALKNGGDHNTTYKTSFGDDPLIMLTVRAKCLPLTELLLDYGADPTPARWTVQDQNYATNYDAKKIKNMIEKAYEQKTLNLR